MAPPRLLADEMVGRLARYLRMMGADAEYARGWSDDEIVRRAAAEGRTIVTRDRALAHRAVAAVLLTSPRLEDQVREVRLAFPELDPNLTFERCTLCNGVLAPFQPDPADRANGRVPARPGLALFRCAGCGHVYWEGSHTDSVRRRLRAWQEAVGTA